MLDPIEVTEEGIDVCVNDEHHEKELSVVRKNIIITIPCNISSIFNIKKKFICI